MSNQEDITTRDIVLRILSGIDGLKVEVGAIRQSVAEGRVADQERLRQVEETLEDMQKDVAPVLKAWNALGLIQGWIVRVSATVIALTVLGGAAVVARQWLATPPTQAQNQTQDTNR